MPPGAQFIVVRVEAQGYLPVLSTVLRSGETNCTVAMHRGEGPHGVVVGLNGQPVAGLTVVYLAGREQAFLPPQGPLIATVGHDGLGPSEMQTDAQGNFAFAPKLGEGVVLTMNEVGFAQVPVLELQTNRQVRLQPWAQVRGRLQQHGQPLAREAVDLESGEAFHPDRPIVGMYGTRTDADGRFAFERVPPGTYRLTTRVLFQGNPGTWTNQPQKRFTARPGATTDVGVVEKQMPQTAAFPGGGSSIP